MNRKKILLLLLCFCLCFFCSCKSKSYLETSDETAQDSSGQSGEDSDTSDSESGKTTSDDANSSEDSEQKDAKIYVQVSGAVAKPGVYTFSSGSRIYQAIESAGGFLPEAYEVNINQAKLLEDGQRIHVYTKEEAKSGQLSVTEVGDEASVGGTSATGGLININTATAEQLTNLSGIGQTRAESIVAYRQKNGNFSSKEDLKNVSGIGDSTYEKIQDQITVD